MGLKVVLAPKPVEESDRAAEGVTQQGWQRRCLAGLGGGVTAEAAARPVMTFPVAPGQFRERMATSLHEGRVQAAIRLLARLCALALGDAH